MTVDVGRSDYGEPFPIAPISVEYVLWVGSRHKDAPQIRAIPFFWEQTRRSSGHFAEVSAGNRNES